MDEKKVLTILWEWHCKVLLHNAEVCGSRYPFYTEHFLIEAQEFAKGLCPTTYEELIQKEERIDELIRGWELLGEMGQF